MKKTIDRHSNRRQQRHPKKKEDGQANLRKRRTVVLASVGVAAVVVVSLILWRINKSGESPLAAGQAVSAHQTAVTHPDFQKLVGRWIRLDTPYVIEIQSASQDGTLHASYFNPRSINVSVAKARDSDGTLEVFVELRDAAEIQRGFQTPARKLVTAPLFVIQSQQEKQEKGQAFDLGVTPI